MQVGRFPHQRPVVRWETGEEEPGYMVGVALDELVAYAIEQGCPEHELRERLEEAIERAAES